MAAERISGGVCEMTALERVRARLAGRPADRMPNLSLVMQFAARRIGVPYGQYLRDGRLLARGVSACCRRFGIDMPMAISDNREAAGYGARIVYPEDAPSYIAAPVAPDLAAAARLRPAPWETVRPMMDRVEAVALLRADFGPDEPVGGWVEGPVAQLCELMGMTQAMLALMDEEQEQAMEDFLALCTAYAAQFARAQIAAGASWIGVGDAAASLIGPRLYGQLALPFERQLIDAIHAAGGLARLHICGNIGPILPLVARTGADIVDCDHMVDMTEAAAVFPEEMAICGNFDPVRVLLQGTPELVRREVRRCVELGALHRNLVAPGCEVPRDTPEANMDAFTQALSGR